MKNRCFLLILLLAAAVFAGCDKEDEIPAMSRTTVVAYGPDFADIQGRIYLTGGSPIERSGACWVLKSTVPADEKALEFATLDNTVQDSEVENPEPGIFQMRVTGLQPDTVYYVRFFASNKQGTFYSYPARVKTGKIYDDFCFVESGTYSMGNAGGAVDEMPVHQVELSHNFYISTKEITNAEFCEFLNKQDVSANGAKNGEKWIDMTSPDVLITLNGSSFVPKAGAGDKPAICVTWYGAEAYCKSRGGYLPTEAEWEFAAKGGLSFANFKYSGSDRADEVGWFDITELQVGGAKKSNGLGVYDMSGNVAEWCNDWYSDKAYENSVQKDPEGPKSGDAKVTRGGSYDQSPSTVTARGSMKPGTASTNVGFRVVIKL